MLKVLDRLEETKTLHPLNFFKVAAIAIYRDIFTHLCLIYEIKGQGKSFWYIEKELANKIAVIARDNSLSIDNLKNISERIKPIRNNTHFHIGSKNPNNPKKIFQESDIKNHEVRELIKSGFIILNELYKDLNKVEYDLPDYDGTDIKNILDSYIKAFPENGIVT